MAPREVREPAARSKNSFWMSGYRFCSSWPYMSHAPTVLSRSCTGARQLRLALDEAWGAVVPVALLAGARAQLAMLSYTPPTSYMAP